MYVVTLVLQLTKGRFVKIGIDSSYQFESSYMCKMANKIIQAIKLDKRMLKEPKEETERAYVDKTKHVLLDYYQCLLQKFD